MRAHAFVYCDFICSLSFVKNASFASAICNCWMASALVRSVRDPSFVSFASCSCSFSEVVTEKCVYLRFFGFCGRVSSSSHSVVVVVVVAVVVLVLVRRATRSCSIHARSLLDMELDI